jgi:flagellar protein FliO/FliZ
MNANSGLFIPTLLLATPVYAANAEIARPPFAPVPSSVSSGSIVQIIFSLLLVIAAIMLVAWLLKRVNAGQLGSGNMLKILGSVAIGQRERIVLVEVKDTWLVVGVGPGQIRTLHTLNKQEIQEPEIPGPGTFASESKFAKLLSSVLRHQPSNRKSNVS